MVSVLDETQWLLAVLYVYVCTARYAWIKTDWLIDLKTSIQCMTTSETMIIQTHHDDNDDDEVNNVSAES